MNPQHQVIRASAGTGKTYQLATRYLTLLRLGVPPASILATTFTRKAAGEILGRVLVRLAKAADDEQEAKRLANDVGDPSLDAKACRRMLAELCAGLHRVAISTLDSFFNRVAQSFRYELEVPPAMTMAAPDEPRIVQARLRAIEAALAGEEVGVLLDLLRRLHHDTMRTSVTRAIDEIVSELYESYRLAPQEAAWTAIAVPAGPDQVEVDAALAALAAEVDRYTDNKNVRYGLDQALHLARQADWESLVDTRVANAAENGELYHKKPVPEPIAQALKLLLARARADLIGRYARMNEATFHLLERFDAHFTPLRLSQGLLLFSDLPHRLVNWLEKQAVDDDGAREELYYRLDAQVGHLLLDEFQDTSPEQWRVLLPLAREICAHADSTRTFFCVGDAKQAIYGWRGGSAELFDGLVDGLNLTLHARKSMSKSYRSAQVVLDAVNQVFEGDAPREALHEHAAAVAAWQAGFVEHTTAKKEMTGYVELVTSRPATTPEDDRDDDGKPNGNDREEASAAPASGGGSGAGAEPLLSPTPHEDFAAQRIAEIVAQAPGRSVGVLVGRNATVRMMIDLLRRKGVPASGEGGTPLTDDPAVNVVLSAMTMADHPGDETAVYHVLHSPLAAVLGLTSSAAREVQRVALAVRRALTEHGYAQVVSQWARALAPACDARSALRLRQLVELGDRYDPEITLRPRRFAEFVRATPIEEPSPAAVRVMTVHAAKGLEFDVVVLPELDRGIVSLGQVGVFLDRPAPSAPIRAVYRSVKKAQRELMPEVKAAYDQECGRRLRDDLSALYVAMTRARHALHMIVKPLTRKKDGSPGSKGLSNLSYASILRAALHAEGDEGFEGGQVLYQRGERIWDLGFGIWDLRREDAGHLSAPATKPTDAVYPPLPWDSSRETRSSPSPGVDLPPAWRSASGRPARSWAMVSPSSLERQGHVKVEDLLGVAPSPGRARGSLFHAWFELVEYLGEGEAALTDADLLAAAARAGAAPAEAEAELPEFRRMLAQPGVAEALRRTGPKEAPGATFELWRERAFAVRMGDRLLSGTFDRVRVARAGGRPVGAEVLDYKTDRLTPGDAAGLADAIEHYRPQVTAYIAALRAMLGLERPAVRARLLFVAIGVAAEVS